MIEGLRRFELARHADDRGWFSELARASALPKPIRQLNLSRSRRGVIRGLHYHERGQDDLFVCLAGMVRVVVLDRATGEAFSEDIGDDNPVAIYVPGINPTATRRWPMLSSLTSSPRNTTRTIRTSTAFPGTTRASSTCGAPSSRSSRHATPQTGRRRGEACRYRGAPCWTS